MTTPSSSSDLAADSRSAIELDRVGLCYRRRGGFLGRRSSELWALEEVSLSVRRGETLGVIGRNGAGKSSLLKLLAGIIRPDRGTMVSHADSISLLSLQVGFVPHLTGRINVILSGLLLGLSRQEIEQRLPAIEAFAELEDRLDEPIATYSSGMRARLGFATAFHVDPDVLLIDEVLGVGDAAFVKKSKAVMRERLTSSKTVVLVSHSAGAVRSLCDRAVWLEGGRVAAEGSPDTVIETYLESTRQGR